MKCLRIVGQGIPVRMSDADAARIIAEGDGEYCKKEVWKRFHDTNADPDFRERVRVRLTPTGRSVRL
jgi:hypothetical protein